MMSLISAARPEVAIAQKPADQKTFASPEDASAAVVAAAKHGDQNALLAIFGSDARGVLFSGDPVKDKIALQDFVAAYTQMNRWRPIKAGGQMLYTGADNHIFPIPLDRNSSGRWYFDTAAGKDEILARRIGRGELTAIAACGALADAQDLYFSQPHDGDKVRTYAQKFVSDPGKAKRLVLARICGPASPVHWVHSVTSQRHWAIQIQGDKPATVQWLLLPNSDQTGKQRPWWRKGLHHRMER
jgi:hypothetical protein